jgi:hypothetical protein
MRTVTHTCHWPGCTKPVPPAMWGCKPHWFQLPKRLRDAIWAAYVPGQEITKTPSPEYIAVAQQVQIYCQAFEFGKKKMAELAAEKRRES